MPQPIQSAIPEQQRANPANLDINPDNAAASSGSLEPGSNSQGPGASATSAQKPKPHDSKVLNKLDPRFDSDALEAQAKGQLSGQEQRPGVSK
ncbi:hypothetical protein ASPSYDRAFT_51430 [Aspergillus sydowii CBS 593.65]|uniref:Uncharacterized protein n=1 Tax=Aspergillus sydowii CBS 593.65 TaxID=1036612 RepID=A0A1L9SZZ5_9EURO|nr:uncharacterized protein ASPSYDRAFT_51430 [Aspergillus sydowii CBS 593.65]OJJ52735.1 hypothetical protein ASPSYDRAFT_51430 [Aspergillus sydowii CBS 593.65]